MKKRLFAFWLILVLVAGLVPVVAAQDDASKLDCLGLSADDCAILQAAHDNLSEITSFTPTFSFTEDFSGVDAIMSAMGAGGAAAMPGAGSGTDAMMSAMMSSSSASIQGSGAVVLDEKVLKSDTPYKGVAVSFDITGSATSAGKDTPVKVGFTLVDGVVYWQQDGKWQGVALDDMMTYFKNGGGMGLQMFGMPMAMMPGGMANMMPGMMQGMMGAVPESTETPGATPSAADMQAQLGALLQTPGFLKQERLEDAQLLGQNMHVFAFTGDIGVLMKSAQVQKAVGDLVSSAMSSQAGAAGAGANGGQAAQMMALYIPVLLESTTGTATLTRWIGADDQFLHQVAFDLNATIDLNGGTASSKVTPLPPITFKLNVTLTLDKINSTTAPTAPAGATMMKPEDIFPTPEVTATPA